MSTLSLTNYSGDLLTTEFANTCRLSSQMFDSTTVIVDRYTIKIDPIRLECQADVFARTVMSKGINLQRILGRNEKNYVEDLKQLYIYSYAKAFVYGWNIHNVSVDNQDTYVFRGHGIMSHMIAKRRVTFDYYEGIDLNTVLIMSEEDYNANVKILKDNFPWLNSFDESNISGSFTFINEKFERLFANIVNFKLNTKQDFKSESDTPEIIGVNALGADVSTLKMSDVSSYFTSTTFCVGNSFYDTELKKFYFINNPLINVQDRSIAFSRAIFLVHVGSGFNSKATYASVDIQNDLGKFAKYEARSITNLEIKYLPSNDLQERLISKIGINEIVTPEEKKFGGNNDKNP